MQNLLYALIQVIHNFGAMTIVGLGFYGIYFEKANPSAKIAFIQTLAWMIQGIGGAAFGLTTYFYYGHLPDIHGIAIVALLIKMACVLAGLFLSGSYALWYLRWSVRKCRFIWCSSFTLSAVALTSAAFLRWFS